MSDKDDTIDETNYKTTAIQACRRYGKLNMMADELFWSHIIMLYNREITDLEQKIRELESKKADKP